MQERYKPTGVNIGYSVPTGGLEILKNGNTRRATKYKEFKPTAAGEIEIPIWIEKALEEVRQNGHEVLFEQIKDHWRPYKWLSKESDLLEWSLDCYYNKAYLWWEDFWIIWG